MSHGKTDCPSCLFNTVACFADAHTIAAMKKRIPKIDITFCTRPNKKIKIKNILIDGVFCDEVQGSPVGNFKGNSVLTQKSVKTLSEVKTHCVTFIEVNENTDNADVAYAAGDHGCNSFDEYMDKCNFPEDYE